MLTNNQTVAAVAALVLLCILGTSRVPLRIILRDRVMLFALGCVCAGIALLMWR